MRKGLLKTLLMTSTSMMLAACSGSTDQMKSPIAADSDNAELFQKSNITDFSLAGTKKVVLTYDDGPTPSVTTALLDYLKEEGVRATFFIVGNNGKNYPSVLARMQDEGHIIANHSANHANLRGEKYTSGSSAIINNILSSHNELTDYMSPSHRLYFRAPFGAWNSGHANKLNGVSELRDYIGPVFWDIGGELKMKNGVISAAADWNCWSAGVSAAKCAEGYAKEITRREGGVILMHDVKMNSVVLTKHLIPWLKKNGYEIISLDDVRALDKYQYAVLK